VGAGSAVSGGAEYVRCKTILLKTLSPGIITVGWKKNNNVAKFGGFMYIAPEWSANRYGRQPV
jgi:hypothetical protein